MPNLKANQVLLDPVVQKTFPRYLKIIQNQAKARFLLAKQMKIDPDILRIDNEHDLWKVHDQLAIKFRELLTNQTMLSQNDTYQHPNYLDVKIRLASFLESPCRLCERKCERKRSEGEVGYCLVPENGSFASTFLHYGEESVLVPSGTIFFNGCTFKCVFCQNWDIANKKYASDDKLPENLTFKEKTLARQGARNLNYVGGDPSPNIRPILQSWSDLNSNVTQLFNSNHYLSLEGMKLIEDIFDFWLPDFKYWDNDFAFKHSKVKNYRETITRNLMRCVEFGSCEMIVRHLVMPGRVEQDTKPILQWIKDELDPYGTVMVNIMSQYHPDYKVGNDSRYNTINRSPFDEEMNEAYKYAKELNLKYEIVS